MKPFLNLTLLVLVAFSSEARADITKLTAKFGGGCASENKTGSCTIKVTAEGSDLSTETVQVFWAPSRTGNFRKVSNTLHSVSETGRASIRFRNVSGACYQVRTGENGNDKADHRSRTLCE